MLSPFGTQCLYVFSKMSSVYKERKNVKDAISVADANILRIMWRQVMINYLVESNNNKKNRHTSSLQAVYWKC